MSFLAKGSLGLVAGLVAGLVGITVFVAVSTCFHMYLNTVHARAIGWTIASGIAWAIGLFLFAIILGASNSALSSMFGGGVFGCISGSIVGGLFAGNELVLRRSGSHKEWALIWSVLALGVGGIVAVIIMTLLWWG
jgi:hypothetical protein